MKKEKIWTDEEFYKVPLHRRAGCFQFKFCKKWFVNGKLHRLYEPAIEYNNGTKFWYKEGKLHRLDGPAYSNASGTNYWFIEGKEYTEEEFNKISFAILNGLEIFL